MPQQVSIAFCIPAYGRVHPDVMVNVAKAYQQVIAAGAAASLNTVTVPQVDVARQELVRGALAGNPTHLMWVDTDVLIPPDAPLRLLAHRKPVVSGLYHYKHPPYAPVVLSKRLERVTALDSESELHEVGGAGMGCCLVAAEVYGAVRDGVWYRSSLEQGEDTHFFRRLQEIGCPAHLDPTVRCGHVTERVITTDDWQR